jgi:hypothetical protein
LSANEVRQKEEKNVSFGASKKLPAWVAQSRLPLREGVIGWTERPGFLGTRMHYWTEDRWAEKDHWHEAHPSEEIDRNIVRNMAAIVAAKINNGDQHA